MWNDKTWLGQAISGTIWAFPVIETIHILALTMMFGAIVIIDLRMLGVGMKKQPVTVLDASGAEQPAAAVTVERGRGLRVGGTTLAGHRCYFNYFLTRQ